MVQFYAHKKESVELIRLSFGGSGKPCTNKQYPTGHCSPLLTNQHRVTSVLITLVH